VIEVCDEAGQGWSSASVCLTACDTGACTACRPGAVRCNARTVERCVPEGIGREVVEECEGRCESGVCTGAAVCEPGTRRCSGQDIEVCTPDAAGWLLVESCMQVCDAGGCLGPACLPLTLTATPRDLPADGTSSALVVSDLILDVQGRAVPDGTLFTLEVDGATVLAADGDPNTPGIQVRSLNGRIDFGVRAGEVPSEARIRATHPVAVRCGGEAGLRFVDGAGPSLALDFTDDMLNDDGATTALWDTILGRIDPFPSDFGGGEDGELSVGATYNLNRDSQPGRLFPDAVNFKVLALGLNSATVEGGVGGVDIGDEVLVINLQGTPEAHGNVGNWELLEIASIDYGANTVFFTTALRQVYGVADDSADLTGQAVMLQRVPHYTDVTVTGTLTADSWDGERGGVLFFKALGSTEVRSTIHLDDGGYRYVGDESGESYAGSGSATRSRNFGAGGGSARSLCEPSPNPSGCCSGWQNANACGAGASYGTEGSAQGGSEAGAVYGEPELAHWFLGSGGGGRWSGQYRYCCNHFEWRNESRPASSNGGGIVVIWSGGISVRGRVSANSGSGTHGGSGGSVFLRARSMNVGSGLVQAVSRAGAGAGRVRLDFFGLAGVTSPAYHPGFAGDTVAVTGPIDATDSAILSVTLLRALTDERGGALAFEATNDGGDTWHAVVPGERFAFPVEASDLRLRVSFSNENLQPLTLNGLAVTYEPAP